MSKFYTFRLFLTIPILKYSRSRLVFTHFDKVVTLAPDLLRKIAQTYSNEDDAVKLQALNLAAKLWASNDEYRKGKLAALINYVFQLARYDKSYGLCLNVLNFNKSGNT